MGSFKEFLLEEEGQYEKLERENKKRFPKGTRIQFVGAKDHISPPVKPSQKKKGTVQSVDTHGGLRVIWDGGKLKVSVAAGTVKIISEGTELKIGQHVKSKSGRTGFIVTFSKNGSVTVKWTDGKKPSSGSVPVTELRKSKE